MSTEQQDRLDAILRQSSFPVGSSVEEQRRILRDLTFYLRHDNDDHILATIGRAVLGEQHDVSFYKP